jgi:hypothetical protein
MEEHLDAEAVELCVRAITTAARDLELDPTAFAEELAQGEIGLLIQYLRAAAPHVPELERRSHIQALLHRLTTWTSLDRAP